MRLNYSKTFLAFFSLFVIFLSGCSSDSPTEPERWDENSSTFEVEWKEGVVKFDKSDPDILSVDSSDYSVVFRASSEKAANLKAGDVVVLGDYAIRKVKSVATLGQKKIVQTELCPLTEAMRNADIEWDYGIEFTPEATAASLKKSGATIQTVGSDSLKFGFKMYNYEISGSFKFNGADAKLDLTIEKAVGNVKPAKMIVSGTLRRFRSKGKVKIENGRLVKYESDAQGMKGDFTVKIIAAGSGDDFKIEIPATLFSSPMGVPFFKFEFKLMVVLNAHIPAEGSALLEERFVYDADQGFSYVGGSATPRSNLRKSEIKKSAQKQHIGAASVAQMAWGIAAPRFEISLAGTTIAWFHTAYLLDAYYRFNPACQMITAHFFGAAGWSIGALTVSLASKSYNLWDKKLEILKAGNCPN